MNKKDPMEELHRIREENYRKTKNMSAKEYFAHISKGAQEFEKLRGKAKSVKSINKLFNELKKAG